MSRQFRIQTIEKVKQGLYALVLADGGLDFHVDEGCEKLVICSDLLVIEGLCKGQIVGETEFLALKQKQVEISAYQQALRYLGSNAHFVAQMRLKLKQRQFDEPVIDTVVERLLNEGLLDDQATAHQWVKSHQFKKSSGLIGEKLKSYLVKPEWIQEALESIEVPRDELMMEQARKKWRLLTEGSRHEDQKNGEKLIAYLMRQGYSYRECKRALEVLKSPHSWG